ncbi:MAG: hypothetical protein HFF62_12710 [Oscillospiraceae bacterium]|jgi:hypothetical protein|nr:hypothetical protein [Oscillospiraceae bacterium]
MVDYKKMYLTLFNATEDAINALENVRQALIQAQRECEELYVSAPAQDEESESGELTVLSAT